MDTRFSGRPVTVMFTPRGSIHEKPSGLTPNGMGKAVSPANSAAETEVRLPACKVTVFAMPTATDPRAIGSSGASTSASAGSKSVLPSQPSVIEPSGARSTPPCVICEAKIFRLPPAESGVAREPEPTIVTEPGVPPWS